MLTLHPVVLRGRTELPFSADELSARVATVQRELGGAGVDALVAFGDARSYAPLAWVTGMVPMLKWAVAVVPASGETELYSALPGARDLRRVRTLAHVGSVAPIGQLAGGLARFRRVMVAGLRSMRARTEDAIRGAVQVLDGGDQLIDRLSAVPSERERELLRGASEAARLAASETVSACQSGAGAVEALLRGDLAAREAGMHDVRVLWSPDAGLPLRPLAGETAVDRDPLVFYFAVETGGYWGEALACAGGPATLPAALAPVARLGLSVQEGVEDQLTPGFYSRRSLDASGVPCSQTIEVG